MQGPPQGRRGPPNFHDQGFGGSGPRGYPADRGDYGYGGGHDMMGLQPSPQMGHQLGNGNPVVMVYNMNSTQMNCEKLFNLLCLYGNVTKVTLLLHLRYLCLIDLFTNIFKFMDVSSPET